jgi:FkbM family methyltransferase
MLHLAHSKPQIPRTKRFPIAYTRNKSVTSNLISTSVPPRTLTQSIAQNLKPSRLRNSANHVGVMSKYFDTPSRANREFPERNTQFTTHRCRDTSTSVFHFASAHLGPIASSLAPAHVRVLSEYSDRSNQTNRDFLEENTRFDTAACKRTLTSFLNLRGARIPRKHLSRPTRYRPAMLLTKHNRPWKHLETMPDLPAYNRLRACRYGQILYNVHDMYIGRSLDLYGEFSEGEVDLFRQMTKPGHTVVEVGANIGAHTVFFARQVGPRGRVIAFEPQRIIFQTLCANVALNSLTNVECFQHAVGSAAGTIVVPPLDYTQDDNYGGLALGGFSDGESVPVVTLDSLALPKLNVLKIDVEGMEHSVLTGAAETLNRCRPILYVENDRADRSDELIRLLDSLEYNLYWHMPPLFNPHNFAGNGVNVFGQIISKNMIAVHRTVPQKLDGFEPVRVP